MSLVVAPLSLSDWDTMSAYSGSYPPSDLVAPIMLGTWPIKTAEEGTARFDWSIKQQREQFLRDPTAHFMKVVDTDNEDEILSLARWHYYEKGFPKENTYFELDSFAPPGRKESVWPKGLNAELHKAILTEAVYERAKWTKGPNWTLSTLITRSSYRCRGAGGMLVEWGCKRADADKTPSYIEASEAGLPLYEKFGFERKGLYKFDMKPFGAEGSIELVLLGREPKQEE